MKSFLIFFCFGVLTWQALVISNTIAQRLDQRTQQINYLLSEQLGDE